MASLDIPALFHAAAEILIREDHSVSIEYSSEEVRIRFPTTRKLARYLDVPHYYVLPVFSMMEEKHLVRREERVGISTTSAGTMLFLKVVGEAMPDEATALLGEGTIDAITAKISSAVSPSGLRTSPD
ncbi:hypothetical protein [Methanogenium organophilum]|uniref:Uncharacterized protein n=1 Tax=Methanogenium organophilum TaxID=2199 RepID=A0A9X9S5D6_METOG|nr:hypothetical protein [Methanogenium organophilum]WAI02027.1 hypothetical protein OU421_03925 [Methanogenium organophilum]